MCSEMQAGGIETNGAIDIPLTVRPAISTLTTHGRPCLGMRILFGKTKIPIFDEN